MPTILVFVLLHFYLRAVLYKPLRRVLAARRERTEGRQEAARQMLAQAEAKLAGYEAALRQQRQQNYQRIEGQRQEGLALSQTKLTEARKQSAHALVEARQQLAAETAVGRVQLQAGAEALAGQIVQQMLGGGATPRTAPGAGA
ncbi:MAG TPA: hypothetical protein VMV31_10160 [Terriglobales bacterium]|nr:hypothetical protein [Terriglobales bacterium]